MTVVSLRKIYNYKPLEGRSLREMRRLAVDRGRWKEYVEAPLTL
jgi:hypothetical protein